MLSNKFKLVLTNAVTFLRMLGIGVLIPIYKLYGGFSAFLLSVGCFLTDMIDGKMARIFNTSTFFGSLFDGLADKLFLMINMVLLISITPLAWIPIVLELGIAGVQILKYKNNLNVKSNIIGKTKMWVAGITISLIYLLVDVNFLNYFSVNLASKIQDMNQIKLFSAFLTPLVLSESATLCSYIKELLNEKKDSANNIKTKEKERRELQKEIQQDIADKKIREIIFDHDFYEKYQDSSNLMDITKEIVRKRVRK